MRLKHARISRFTSNIFKIFASGGARCAWTPSRFARALRTLVGDAGDVGDSSFARRHEIFILNF
jgi:hypothetical protein